MKLTKEEYANLISKRPHLVSRPAIQESCNSHTRTVAKLESNPCNASLEPQKLQGATETAIVRITSVRKTLLDTDNICSKYLVDLLRYANILYDDSPEQTSIQTSQRKCVDGEKEHTIVEIEIYDKKEINC